MDETQHNAGCKHLTKIVSKCDITGNINVRCANCLYINWNTTLSNTPAIRNKLVELLYSYNSKYDKLPSKDVK